MAFQVLPEKWGHRVIQALKAILVSTVLVCLGSLGPLGLKVPLAQLALRALKEIEDFGALLELQAINP